MEIRELCPQDWDAAAALVWQVFQRFEAPEYSQEGVDSFAAFLKDRPGLLALKAWGAWEDGALLGVLAVRAGERHVCLCFVREDWHRRGVGRALWQRFLEEAGPGRVTVNSSPYAVGFYESLGFRAVSGEQVRDGIRFTPMERVL